MELKDFFVEHPKVAIAFSGGTDSAYLLYAAKQYAKEVQAYFVKTAFQPQFEIDDALCLAKELCVQMKMIPLDIFSDEKIISNSYDRCYYCKKRILTAIIDQAKIDGFSVLLDGTNASDEADDRPGMKALRELSVNSPLRLYGLTKDEIRRLSKEANLFTWNKPAYACLATRIPTGQPIESRFLKRTEIAEDYMFSLGFFDFRIRTVGETAKIQISEGDIPLLIKNRKRILNKLIENYESVCLDLEVRNEN